MGIRNRNLEVQVWKYEMMRNIIWKYDNVGNRKTFGSKLHVHILGNRNWWKYENRKLKVWKYEILGSRNVEYEKFGGMETWE